MLINNFLLKFNHLYTSINYVINRIAINFFLVVLVQYFPFETYDVQLESKSEDRLMLGCKYFITYYLHIAIHVKPIYLDKKKMGFSYHVVWCGCLMSKERFIF